MFGFKRKQQAPTPLTPEEAIRIANQDFNVDVVRNYQEEAIYRERFRIINDIKASIQRKADADLNEYTVDSVVVFVDNARAIGDFFIEKGFETNYSLEEINGKNSFHISLTW